MALVENGNGRSALVAGKGTEQVDAEKEAAMPGGNPARKRTRISKTKKRSTASGTAPAKRKSRRQTKPASEAIMLRPAEESHRSSGLSRQNSEARGVGQHVVEDILKVFIVVVRDIPPPVLLTMGVLAVIVALARWYL